MPRVRSVDPPSRSCRSNASTPAWMRPGADSVPPVVVEITRKRVTDIAMGTESDAVVEIEALAASPDDAPTLVALLD